jgi:hypothetical protein
VQLLAADAQRMVEILTGTAAYPSSDTLKP